MSQQSQLPSQKKAASHSAKALLVFILIIFFSVTSWSIVHLQETGFEGKITDMGGHKHPVKPKVFYILLGISWACHMCAGLLTIFYYLSHPSRVSLHPRGKCHVWILGTKVPSSSDSALIDVEAGISEKKNRKQSYWCCSKGRTRQQSFCVN